MLKRRLAIKKGQRVQLTNFYRKYQTIIYQTSNGSNQALKYILWKIEPVSPCYYQGRTSNRTIVPTIVTEVWFEHR